MDIVAIIVWPSLEQWPYYLAIEFGIIAGVVIILWIASKISPKIAY